MLAKFTDIILLLDRSASMIGIAEATREGLNAFLKEQQELPGEARFTLAQFSDPHDFRYSHQNLPIKAVEPITELTYKPGGSSTALRDALARLIDETGQRYAQTQESQRPERVVFVVVTDGLENSSYRTSAEVLASKIQTQSNVYKWQFVYLGANQDAILEAGKYNIGIDGSLTYVASEQGVTAAYAATSQKLGLFRSSLADSVTFDDEDRKNAVRSGS